MPIDPLAMSYSLFRVLLIAGALLGCGLLWRRPRPGAAFALVLAMSLLAWAAYVLPLGRPYGLLEHSDRGFAVGIVAVAATGNSPWEHTQVGFGNLEPFWSLFGSFLALRRPENAAAVFQWLAPASLILTALGLYLGLRRDESQADAWERALIVMCALGLSSFSLSQRPPIPALWAGNFLYKPNHAAAWGLVGIAVGLAQRRLRPWALGGVLGLMAWVFLLDWAFLLPGLVLGMLLRPRAERDLRSLWVAIGVSVLIAAPYIAHLGRDYSPFESAGSPEQIWRDSLGERLAPPHWATLDLGPLFFLGVFGAFVLWRRGTSRDRLVLGLLAAVWLFFIAYQVGAQLGVSPEPDEHHYFLRLAMAIAAGSALAAGARQLESWRQLRPGQGAVIALAVCLPLTFPAYWDPPSMDRYWRWNRAPIGPKVLAYGAWVRENTPPQAVFAAGPSACVWIPALAGRRVLLVAESRPPKDYRARKEVERTLLLSRRPDLIRAAARRYGVEYLAIDGPMLLEYGEDTLAGLASLSVYEQVYRSSAVQILKLRP